ncbi:MAG: hypothetical protein H0V14_12310 [Chitinophagaceae bacterium]|nr:hypothetical protein [Chitinophagaceae bacterium]
MDSANFKKAFILTLLVVVSLLTCWELYLRKQGLSVDYDDGKELWADKRAMIYKPIDKATVFIGSSRNKYDIDIETWESTTGEHAILLAIEGNSPLPVLDDLANDEKFKGKLVVDVTEELFFFSSANNLAEPKEHVSYYKERTPAQRFSFLINYLLESQFVFLDKYNFSLHGMLSKLRIPNRKDVLTRPFEYPLEAGRITFDRQNIMMEKFLVDTNLQNEVKALWVFFHNINEELPPIGNRLDSFFTSIKKSCDKIKAKGGQVLFVRTPCSGPELTGSEKAFPRERYWNRLLNYTNCLGVHFADYHAIDHFKFPEYSHLGRPDAITFTKNIIKILEEEKGWTFQQKATFL